MKMVIFPGKVLENDIYPWKIKHLDKLLFFYVSLPQIIINQSYFNEKKTRTNNVKKAIYIYLFWLICDLVVNYMEIQDFVE